MNKMQNGVEVGVFLTIGLLVLMAVLAMLDVVAAIGWALRLLEIQSIYDRLLPSWTAMDFFIASVSCYIAVKWLSSGVSK